MTWCKMLLVYLKKVLSVFVYAHEHVSACINLTHCQRIEDTVSTFIH